MQNTTQWAVQTSLKYEVLCFLGVLTGDPFYTCYYEEEYRYFADQLDNATPEALARILTFVKGKGGIVGAGLAYLFSLSEAETLDDLIALAKYPSYLQQQAHANPHLSIDYEGDYEPILADVHLVLSFLKNADFESYWQKNFEPHIIERINAITGRLPEYDIVPAVEKALGKTLSDRNVTVYMLYFNKPHGIKVAGNRFISGHDNSFELTVRIAIHELMHPPYDYDGDDELRTALQVLRNDAFFMDKVENHNPSFGYNSFEGLLEEDVVQSLDQTIGESFGVTEHPAGARWQKSDDGMHVLALALYSLMKSGRFLESDETIREFLLRHVAEGGALRDVKRVYDEFYGEEVNPYGRFGTDWQ